MCEVCGEDWEEEIGGIGGGVGCECFGDGWVEVGEDEGGGRGS